MPDDPHLPRVYDAVLGGQNPPPPGGVVLGGIEGVKYRLASTDVQVRVAALRSALDYGDAGLELVIQSLQDELIQVKNAAVMLLQALTAPKAKLALLLQNEPQDADAYNKRGAERASLGDYQGAIADFSHGNILASSVP